MSALPRPPIEIVAHAQRPLGLGARRFLGHYWQRHPLLIRTAFPSYAAPITPDDLAGLACEPDALSRLVVHEARRDRWQVRTGPLDPGDFARLPRKDWTLLVQDCDKWFPQLERLLQHFRFLPSWRIDDVMVSYAVDGGSVGAHVDQYDVFLLQAHGRRRWRIDAGDAPELGFRPDQPLKLLQKFHPTHDWLLEPGDMLYLPPGVPHHGIAEGDCLTYSIGMRAPSIAELLTAYATDLAAGAAETWRYRDPGLQPARDAGEIDARALDRVAGALSEAVASSPEALAHWFGSYITRYRSTHDPAPPRRSPDAEAIGVGLADGAKVVLRSTARAAYVRTARGADLFVAGERYACSLAMAQRISGQRRHGADDDGSATTEDLALLAALLRDGHATWVGPRKSRARAGVARTRPPR